MHSITAEIRLMGLQHIRTYYIRITHVSLAMFGSVSDSIICQLEFTLPS